LNVVLNGIYTNTGFSDWESVSSTNSLALNAYWQPSRSGWLPSISAGWGLGTTTLLTPTGADRGGFGFTSNSWMLGLQWQDAFAAGNVLGFAVGQNTMVSKMTGNLSAFVNDNSFSFAAPQDGNYAWEWWYKLQVTDNISVTPALFYLSNPLGQDVKVGGNGAFFNSFGYLIKTTFKF
jgi:carbohydrate-selective porin OprB